MAYQPKSYRKFVAGAATAAIVASAVAPAASAAEVKFTDVGENFWAATEIYALVEAGVINGYPDGTFKPGQDIIRGQAANLLTDALDLEIPSDLNAFPDVSEKSAFAEGAAATKAAGIFTGSEGKFGAGDVLTREQMASVLVRAFDLKANDKEVSFTDWDKISPSHRENVKILAQNDITTGKGDGSFDPKSAINRAQFVTFLYRAMGEVAPAAEVVEVTSVDSTTLQVKVKGQLDEVSASDFAFDGGLEVKEAKIVEAPAAAEEEVYTTVELTTSEQEAGKTYKLVSFLGEEVKGDVTVEVPATPAVTSVSAINVKTLKVEFNQAIEDTSKASFAVKRGNVEVAVTAKWAEDKKSVELLSSGNLVAGDYTVTVNGLDIEENSKAVKVEAEKATSVQILDSKVEFGKNTAPVSFKVFNQYNEEMSVTADKLTWTAYNKTQNTTIGFTANTNGLTLDTDDAGVKEGDQVVLTGVLKSDASVQVSKTVAVSKIVASNLTLQQPVLPEKAERLMQNAGYVEVPYTLTDSEGNAITFPETAEVAVNSFDVNGVKFNTENNNIVTHVKVDAKGKLFAKVADVAGDVSLTGLVKSTGKVAVLNFKVNANPLNDTLTLGAPEKQLTANGAVVKVPLTVTDQYGKAVEAKNVKAEDFIISPSNTTVITGAQISSDGKYVELTPGAKGTSTVIVTSKDSGKSASLSVEVKDAAVPTDVTATLSSTYAAKGAVVNVKGSVFNQYSDALTGNIPNGYHVEVVGETQADNDAITGENNNVTSLDTFKDTGVNLTIASNTTVEKVTLNVKLVKDGQTDATDEVVANKVFTVNVVKADAALSYEVQSVAKLRALGADAQSPADGEYAKELKVVAKDASGNVVTIPASKIVGATSSNTAVANVAKVGNAYKVYGVAAPGEATEATATISLLVEDTDGTVKTVQQTVTVSEEALVAQSVKLLKDSDDTAITEFTVTDSSDPANGTLDELTTGYSVATDDTDFRFVVEDQFGGTSLTSTLTFVVTGTSEFTFGEGDAITVANGTLALVDAGTQGDTTYAADANFVVTAATSNGLTKSLTVKFASASTVAQP